MFDAHDLSIHPTEKLIFKSFQLKKKKRKTPHRAYKVVYTFEIRQEERIRTSGYSRAFLLKVISLFSRKK